MHATVPGHSPVWTSRSRMGVASTSRHPYKMKPTPIASSLYSFQPQAFQLADSIFHESVRRRLISRPSSHLPTYLHYQVFVFPSRRHWPFEKSLYLDAGFHEHVCVS